MYYTGVGSREQFSELMDKMTAVANYLSDNNFILRSGGAGGADTAFQSGASPHKTEIWIPWSSFKPKNIKGQYKVLTDDKFKIAREYILGNNIIPWFDRMKQGAQKLHARNYYQVFGDNNMPSEFLLYSAPVINGEVKGGTRTAVEIAKLENIPVFNISKSDELNKFRSFISAVVKNA
jgi:hypothetical protein